MEMEIISWVGLSQGLFAAILMMTKKNRNDSDKILIAWLSLLAIEFLTCAVDYKLFGNPLLSSSFLLFNPAFYLYINSLIKDNFKLHWLQLLHLFPFVFFEVIAYIIREPYTLRSFFNPDSSLWYRYMFGAASVISWIIYNSYSAILVIQHRKSLENELSNIESSQKLGWLFFIVIFYNSYCIMAVITGIMAIFLHLDFPLPHVFNYSALLLLIYILGFYGLQQGIIFKPDLLNYHEKYSKSLLSPTQKTTIKKKLINYFRDEKPYFDPNLNMNMLSELLNVRKHHLTEVLNADIEKNFFQFVNEYRIEAVKEKLADPKNLYSIEAIGYECGFSSKSSFFTVFKKITGKTPMEFKNKMKKSS